MTEKKKEIVKVYERVYDNPLDKNGVRKPNNLLGEYEILEGSMDDYSYEVYAKDEQGEIVKIIGTEVSGYYLPDKGGTKNRIRKLTDIRDVQLALTTYRNSLREKIEAMNYDSVKKASKYPMLGTDGDPVHEYNKGYDQAIADVIKLLES